MGQLLRSTSSLRMSAASQPDAELASILNRAFPGCRIDAFKPLAGGISARAVVVDLVLSDATKKRVVVRRPNWGTAEETRLAVECEYESLSRCKAHGILAPSACFKDAARRSVNRGASGVPVATKRTSADTQSRAQVSTSTANVGAPAKSTPQQSVSGRKLQ